MPTLDDLGRAVKERYPGAYDDFGDAELGQRVQQRFPGAYDDYQGTDAEQFTQEMAPGQEILSLFGGGAQRAPATQEAVAAREPFPAPPLMPEAIDAAQQPGVLTAAGEAAGSLVPGVRPLTAAAGAAAGMTAERVLRGEQLPSLQELGMEAGLSLAPEVIESTGRAVMRTLIRGTEGAKQIRFSEAAKRARKRLPAVFHAPSRQVVNAQFEALRKAGLPVEVATFGGRLRDLTEGKYTDLLGEIRRIDRNLKTGGRYTEAFQAARGGDPLTLDVGDMQTLRSELRKRAEDVGPFEARQLLRDTQSDIDEAIDIGLSSAEARAQGIDPRLARDARRNYALHRSSEEMADFVEQKIMDTPDLTDVQLNLRSLWTDLRRNTSRRAKQLNRSLDASGSRQAFLDEIDGLRKLYSRIELPLADVSRGRRAWVIAQLGGWLSDIMLTTTGREMFERAVIQGRGRISPNTLAVIANAALRESPMRQQMVSPETVPPTPSQLPR